MKGATWEASRHQTCKWKISQTFQDSKTPTENRWMIPADATQNIYAPEPWSDLIYDPQIHATKFGVTCYAVIDNWNTSRSSCKAIYTYSRSPGRTSVFPLSISATLWPNTTMTFPLSPFHSLFFTAGSWITSQKNCIHPGPIFEDIQTKTQIFPPSLFTQSFKNLCFKEWFIHISPIVYGNE